MTHRLILAPNSSACYCNCHKSLDLNKVFNQTTCFKEKRLLQLLPPTDVYFTGSKNLKLTSPNKSVCVQMNDNYLNQAATTLSTSAGEQQWHKNTTHSLKYKVWHETCGMNSMTFSESRSETRHVEQLGDQRYIKYRQHMFTQVITGRGNRKMDIHQQKQNKITEGKNKGQRQLLTL